MIRHFLAENIAQNLFQIELSWPESDAARDRGEHWLADEIAKRRRALDGQNVAYSKVAQQIGFFVGDLMQEANDILVDLRQTRSAKLDATNIDALID